MEGAKVFGGRSSLCKGLVRGGMLMITGDRGKAICLQQKWLGAREAGATRPVRIHRTHWEDLTAKNNRNPPWGIKHGLAASSNSLS